MCLISLIFGFFYFLSNMGFRDLKQKPQRDEDPIFAMINEQILKKMSMNGDKPQEQIIFKLNDNLN